MKFEKIMRDHTIVANKMKNDIKKKKSALKRKKSRIKT